MYLHGKEVAHLDLKPHNIMLTSAPHIAKLCDFGLTRVTRSSVFKIPKLRPGGTPLYMSPEQHFKAYVSVSLRYLKREGCCVLTATRMNRVH